MSARDPLAVPQLSSLLSAARFATYLTACGGDPAEAIRLYAWNIEASAALWGGFSLLEVCLRNAMHRELTSLVSHEDWWIDPTIRLQREQADAVAKAVAFVRSTKGPGYSADDAVAELTFGFWTALLANRYHQQLWVPALAHSFPQWTGRRGVLQRRLERLRRLRNRVAHHEPIFARNLVLDHDDILSVLVAIDPAARDWVAAESRLPAVIAAKADTVAGRRVPQF